MNAFTSPRCLTFAAALASSGFALSVAGAVVSVAAGGWVVAASLFSLVDTKVLLADVVRWVRIPAIELGASELRRRRVGEIGGIGKTPFDNDGRSPIPWPYQPVKVIRPSTRPISPRIDRGFTCHRL